MTTAKPDQSCIGPFSHGSPIDARVELRGNVLARSLTMIRKIKSGYRLYSRKKNPKTGKRRNLGTFSTRAKAEQHERAVQFFKRRG